ncbi:MAG: ankyrin repeat domain-containing protein [Novosphingobium sp.]|uniref:ankyrin repeat domain-containing protein n=1 Tax=Novosphingobium sp. TaxID=1874826 RepID=UPI0032BD3EFF
MSHFRQLSLALIAPIAVLAVLPAPAQAQFSDSYKFLDSVRKKEGDKVTELLDNGGPNLINTKDQTSGDTALHIVTARRDLTWMEFLIAKGANVNARNFKGQTALVVACNLNWVEGAELLVESGAKVDEPSSTGETPLITAMHNRNIGLIRILLKAGADPDRTDNSGRSARDYARLDPKSDTLLGEIDANAKPKPKPGQGPQVFGPK